MPASNDTNDCIAKAMGWTWDDELVKALWFGYLGRPLPKFTPLTHWRNPEGKPAVRPDFIGTLGGVAGMLRILGPEWSWGWDGTQYVCRQDEEDAWPAKEFFSPSDCPGDCVGEAYMSVFGKEAADGRK